MAASLRRHEACEALHRCNDVPGPARAACPEPLIEPCHVAIDELAALRHTMNHAARKVATDETVRAITGHVTDYDWVNAQEKREAVGGVVRLLGLAPSVTPPGNDSGSGTSAGTSEVRKTAAG